MKKSFLITTVLLMGVFFVKAQEIIPLYTGDIPNAKPTPATYEEKTVTRPNGTISISKVSVPTLTVFEAPKDKATGTAVIICPGGSYIGLAFTHEGIDVAKRFNEIGITAFVLKYRLPSDEIMVDKAFGPLQDAQQAMYIVKKNARKYGIKKDNVGIVGFSAGGHFASSLTTHYADLKIANPERINLRPEFSVLVYPVISLQEFTHAGSKKNLLGTAPSKELEEYFSANKNVNKKTPPVFLVHAKDDKTVPVENSILMNEALKKNKIETEIYLFEQGGHGFGLINKTSNVDWFGLLTEWVKKNKF